MLGARRRCRGPPGQTACPSMRRRQIVVMVRSSGAPPLRSGRRDRSRRPPIARSSWVDGPPADDRPAVTSRRCQRSRRIGAPARHSAAVHHRHRRAESRRDIEFAARRPGRLSGCRACRVERVDVGSGRQCVLLGLISAMVVWSPRTGCGRASPSCRRRSSSPELTSCPRLLRPGRLAHDVGPSRARSACPAQGPASSRRPTTSAPGGRAGHRCDDTVAVRPLRR